MINQRGKNTIRNPIVPIAGPATAAPEMVDLCTLVDDSIGQPTRISMRMLWLRAFQLSFFCVAPHSSLLFAFPSWSIFCRWHSGHRSLRRTGIAQYCLPHFVQMCILTPRLASSVRARSTAVSTYSASFVTIRINSSLLRFSILFLSN